MNIDILTLLAIIETTVAAVCSLTKLALEIIRFCQTGRKRKKGKKKKQNRSSTLTKSKR